MVRALKQLLRAGGAVVFQVTELTSPGACAIVLDADITAPHRESSNIFLTYGGAMIFY
jgi:hypothetical protein